MTKMTHILMAKMKNEPTYYSVLPASVRYDKKLSASAKILYTEIVALTNKEGVCWASNAYFAKLYGVHVHTITSWVNELKDAEHIRVELKGFGKRYIYLREKTYIDTQKDVHQVRENTEQNTTSINTININNKKNNNWLKKIVGYYSLFWKDLYGTDYEVTNWGRLGKTLKPLEKLNDWQLASLIWLHFHWYGASGEDQFAYKQLSEHFFPLDWIPRASNGYKTYLINTLEVEWDNEEAVKKFILPELTKVGWLH